MASSEADTLAAAQVTVLQVTKRKRVCEEAAKLNAKTNLAFSCLEAQHFEPEVAETFPYEATNMAVLAWLRGQPDRCQVCTGPSREGDLVQDVGTCPDVKGAHVSFHAAWSMFATSSASAPWHLC